MARIRKSLKRWPAESFMEVSGERAGAEEVIHSLPCQMGPLKGAQQSTMTLDLMILHCHGKANSVKSQPQQDAFKPLTYVLHK